MKGVILAGGTGSRLAPLTKITNKHLLPVYDKPMIFYPIETLKKLGIKDVLIISGGEHLGQITQLLGDGSNWKMQFNFRVQTTPGGIAHALRLAKDFVGNNKVVVILGDNVFEGEIPVIKDDDKADIVYTKAGDPERFGCIHWAIEGREINKIIEKPEDPPSDDIVTGLYAYPHDIFRDILPFLKESKRGELEITDVNNRYLRQGRLRASEFKGKWTDAGTFESLFRASDFARIRKIYNIDDV